MTSSTRGYLCSYTDYAGEALAERALGNQHHRSTRRGERVVIAREMSRPGSYKSLPGDDMIGKSLNMGGRLEGSVSSDKNALMKPWSKLNLHLV